MREVFDNQCYWSENTFGPYSTRKLLGGAKGLLGHLREEADEVEEVIEENRWSKLPEELADLTIILMELWAIHGLTYDDMIHCVAAKQVKNRQRNWPAIDSQDPGKPINHE